MVKVTVIYEYKALDHMRDKVVDKKCTLEYPNPESVNDYIQITTDLMKVATFSDEIIEAVLNEQD